MYDTENSNTALHSQKEESNDFNGEAYVRLGFIRKVYGILSVMLTISCIFICFSMLPGVHDKLDQTKEGNDSIPDILLVLLVISFIGVFATLIPLFCCRSVAKSVPINYILLFLFTIFESYCLFIISACYEPQIVITAMVLTAAMVIGLTIYAMTTKKDFTMCGGCLFAALFLFIAFGILLAIFGVKNKIGYMFVCLVGILIYSIYLVYDTQLTMGQGAFKYEIDEYVWAAVNLYIDIIEIFIYILRILGKLNNN
jgi:FtsH-binding integral membrane protein